MVGMGRRDEGTSERAEGESDAIRNRPPCRTGRFAVAQRPSPGPSPTNAGPRRGPVSFRLFPMQCPPCRNPTAGGLPQRPRRLPGGPPHPPPGSSSRTKRKTATDTAIGTRGAPYVESGPFNDGRSCPRALSGGGATPWRSRALTQGGAHLLVGEALSLWAATRVNAARDRTVRFPRTDHYPAKRRNGRHGGTQRTRKASQTASPAIAQPLTGPLGPEGERP